MLLAPIHIGIEEIARGHSARNRDFNGSSAGVKHYLDLIRWQLINARYPLRVYQVGCFYALKCFLIRKEDIKGELKRPRVLASDQFGDFPEFHGQR